MAVSRGIAMVVGRASDDCPPKTSTSRPTDLGIASTTRLPLTPAAPNAHIAVVLGGCSSRPSPPTTSRASMPGVTRCVTIGSMIRSFRDRDTERLAQRERVKKWSPELQKAALRKLRMVDAAEEVMDLRVPPGNRLERLKGDRAGQYSIRINDQWRVCFRWERGHAYDVEIVDYH